MKFKVELSRLVRQTKIVNVECDSQEDLKHRLSEVYELEDDLDLSIYGWYDDPDWGCKEGTHYILGEGTYRECPTITLPKK